MSALDDLIAGAVKIGVIKASNPRAVQTAEQAQVSTSQQVNATVKAPGGSAPASKAVSILTDKRVMVGFGVVTVGLVAYLALRK